LKKYKPMAARNEDRKVLRGLLAAVQPLLLYFLLY
jgi:hypothetical protein